jgi:hypothetical protein
LPATLVLFLLCDDRFPWSITGSRNNIHNNNNNNNNYINNIVNAFIRVATKRWLASCS